nr:chitobiase/beta-hexosaminidase C-terminal domain-containing protein [uncultured Carboxylicivirga sp.]
MKKSLLFSLLVLLISTSSFAQLSLDAKDVNYTIDFDNTVSGVNNGAYVGTGYALTPEVGQLNANAFSVLGMSDGDLAFGAEGIEGDYAKGTSVGSTSGGCYGYDVSETQDGSNMIWGVQPTSGDFTPGSIVLKIVNNTGEDVNEFDISYDVFAWNHGDRSVSFNFSYSTDNNTFIDVADLNFETVEAADAEPAWLSETKTTTISTSLASGEELYLKWTCEEVSGSGSRDKLGLDNVVVSTTLNSVATVEIPTFSVESGIYTEAFDLSLATSTEGATIYYTLDGSDPDETSTEFTSAVNISESTVVKAIAIKEGMNNSSVTTATYTFPVECASIAEFLNLDLGTLAILRGVVTEVTVNPDYNTVTSLVVKDVNDATILAYGVYRISDVIYEVGQTLVMTGLRAEFQDEAQMSFSANSGHSIVVDNASGIEDGKTSAFTIAPNPFTTEFKIDGAEVVAVKLYNAAGQLVKNVPVVSGAISTSDLDKGMYILQAKMADGTISTQKVIKK